MQEMIPSHYELFQDYVRMGIFDNESIGPHLRDISSRAKHLVSPIKSDETLQAFGLNRAEFLKYTRAYTDRALPQGKVLPLEVVVCVEDDYSAVFVENHPQIKRTLRLTAFEDVRQTVHPFDGVLSSGSLELLRYEGEGSLFNVFDTYLSFIRDNSILRSGTNTSRSTNKALVDTTNTVIEQLAYMEKEGLLPAMMR